MKKLILLVLCLPLLYACSENPRQEVKPTQTGRLMPISGIHKTAIKLDSPQPTDACPFITTRFDCQFAQFNKQWMQFTKSNSCICK